MNITDLESKEPRKYAHYFAVKWRIYLKKMSDFFILCSVHSGSQQIYFLYVVESSTNIEKKT